MNERLKEYQVKLVEFWNKYTKKQKALVISITLTVVIAIVLLYMVLSRTEYEELITCEDATTAASVTETLTTENIKYTTSSDGLTIRVFFKDKYKK